jgi:hypothetical protein
VHNEVRSGLPSVITDYLKDRVEAYVRKNRRVITDYLLEVFPYFRKVLHEIVTVLLR